MHAFIIEDEYLIARSLQDMLEDVGFTAFSFARSEDAAVMGARGQRIDLVAADVRLLPGDGLKAVEAICENRDVPVLFITGFAPELEDRLEELPETQTPRCVVLQKPVKKQQVVGAVRKLLGAAPG